MNKEDFKAIETQLKDYYMQKKHEKKLKCQIEIIEKHIATIKDEIISLEGFSTEAYCNMSPSFAERVQSSGDKSGNDTEKQMIKFIDRKESELLRSINNLTVMQEKLREIENIVADMDFNISIFNKELQDLLKYLYDEKLKPDFVIDKHFGGSRSTFYSKKQEVIEGIYRFEEGSLIWKK